MIIGGIAVVMSIFIDLNACLTTFINDGKKILIYNKNDKRLIPIYKNGTCRFGNQHEHAHFAVYMQQPKSKFFSRKYICKQNACGKKGNITLKLSDIENQTEATQLFTIVKSDAHPSMVQELPMIQKKNCESCVH